MPKVYSPEFFLSIMVNCLNGASATHTGQNILTLSRSTNDFCIRKLHVCMYLYTGSQKELLYVKCGQICKNQVFHTKSRKEICGFKGCSRFNIHISYSLQQHNGEVLRPYGLCCGSYTLKHTAICGNVLLTI